MTTIFSLLAAGAMGIGLLSGAAEAGAASPSQQDTPFAGMVIVPASADPATGTAADERRSAFTRGEIIDFNAPVPEGDIIVDTRRNRLYFVLGGGKAVAYRVASARKGFQWQGSHEVTAKAKWPSWRPPQSMRKRKPELPRFMAGGPDNPLGARALYLGSSIYRIHGTNEPESIGKAASSGCIRMLNEDVSELYPHVRIGARVTVR